MASPNKIPGAPDFDTETIWSGSDGAPYSWFFDQASGTQPAASGAPELPIPEGSTDTSVKTESTDSAPPADAPGHGALAGASAALSGTSGAPAGTSGAISGTSGADVFALDIGTVVAAVAP